MICEEIKIVLHDFIDESVDQATKAEIEKHLLDCEVCYKEYIRLTRYFEKLRDLPFRYEAPQSLTESFRDAFIQKTILKTSIKEKPKTNIKKFNKEKAKEIKRSNALLKKERARLRLSQKSNIPIKVSYKRKRGLDKRITFYTLLPLIIFVLAYFIYEFQRYNSPWEIKNIKGRVYIDGAPDAGGQISQGESFRTDYGSSAKVFIPKTGRLEVDENTYFILDKAKNGDNVIEMKRGSLSVINTELMPDFSIKISDFTIYDRAGSFNVDINKELNTKIFVEFGFIEVVQNSQSFYINENYYCDVLDGGLIGIPYHKNASDSLLEIVNKINVGGIEENDIRVLIASARDEDVLTLLATIPIASQEERQILYQAISKKFIPPKDVRPSKILQADPLTLYLWWQEIQWQI